VLSFFCEFTPSFKTTSDFGRYRHILSEMVWAAYCCAILLPRNDLAVSTFSVASNVAWEDIFI
jgi:hypothetical protein